MNIIIMGPQASGKGTQAKLLSKKFDLHHFSTGDALRDEIRSGSVLGKQIAEVINQGHLVDDELMFALVKKAADDAPHGIILDGFPRTIRQAEMMKGVIPIDAIFEISVPDALSIQRIASRFICSRCGHGYNTLSLPPKKAGVCDFDGESLVQRDDDTPNAIRKRLDLYHEHTKPVEQYYRDKGVPIFNIDGSGSIEAVNALLCENYLSIDE